MCSPVDSDEKVIMRGLKARREREGEESWVEVNRSSKGLAGTWEVVATLLAGPLLPPVCINSRDRFITWRDSSLVVSARLFPPAREGIRLVLKLGGASCKPSISHLQPPIPVARRLISSPQSHLYSARHPISHAYCDSL